MVTTLGRHTKIRISIGDLIEPLILQKWRLPPIPDWISFGNTEDRFRASECSSAFAHRRCRIDADCHFRCKTERRETSRSTACLARNPSRSLSPVVGSPPTCPHPWRRTSHSTLSSWLWYPTTTFIVQGSKFEILPRYIVAISRWRNMFSRMCETPSNWLMISICMVPSPTSALETSLLNLLQAILLALMVIIIYPIYFCGLDWYSHLSIIEQHQSSHCDTSNCCYYFIFTNKC